MQYTNKYILTVLDYLAYISIQGLWAILHNYDTDIFQGS